MRKPSQSGYSKPYKDDEYRSGYSYRKQMETFTLPLGQVVYHGRYYFVWCKGRFIGTCQTLDDAVESLERWYEENHALESGARA